MKSGGPHKTYHGVTNNLVILTISVATGENLATLEYSVGTAVVCRCDSRYTAENILP